MGSICWIEKDPKKWKLRETTKKLKEEYGGEGLLKVKYGEFDDECLCDMEMYMRFSVWEKILTGEYTVSPNSKWQRKLILVDKEGKEVLPLSGIIY